MKIISLLLILALCGCHKTGETSDSPHDRQAAIAREITDIEFRFAEAVFQLNNTNAADFVAEAESLANHLQKISNDLDTLGPLPVGLRDTTLKKLNDTEAINKLKLSKKTSVTLRPEVAKITDPAVERYFSESASVMMKAGLVTDAKGNPIDVKTTNHP